MRSRSSPSSEVVWMATSEGDGSDAECPACEGAFKNEHGMKIHYAQAHDGSIAGVTCTCDWCGDEFPMKPGKAEARRFCGEDCFHEFEREPSPDAPWREEETLLDLYLGSGMNRSEVATELGCDHPTISKWLDRYDIRKPWERKAVLQKMHTDETMPAGVIADRLGCVERTISTWLNKHDIQLRGNGHRTPYSRTEHPPNTVCEHCGDDFYKKPSAKERRDTHFCWRGCWAEYVETTDFAPDSGVGRRKKAVRVVIECDNCGAEDTRPPNIVYDTNFCDSSCMYEFQRGENHPLWAGGPSEYGPGWNEAKKERVRERDGRTCQECGRTEEEHLEHHGRKHSVHHLQRPETIRDPDVHNHPDNLLTLCLGDCHSKWERLRPLRPHAE